jgi:hypothetical protein
MGRALRHLLFECVCDHAVPAGVRVNVGTKRRRRTDPRPLALADDVQRCAGDERRVGHLQGVLDVGDRITLGRVDAFEETVERVQLPDVCLDGSEVVRRVPDLGQAGP